MVMTGREIRKEIYPALLDLSIKIQIILKDSKNDRFFVIFSRYVVVFFYIHGIMSDFIREANRLCFATL